MLEYLYENIQWPSKLESLTTSSKAVVQCSWTADICSGGSMNRKKIILQHMYWSKKHELNRGIM